MADDSVDSLDYVTVIPSVLGSRARAYIAQEVLKVFLYMNGQTPGPVDAFIAEHTTKDTGDKASLRTRQLQKRAMLIKSHIDILDPSFFMDGSIQGIRALLGPSPMRPWRAIELDFGPLNDEMSEIDAAKGNNIKCISRRVVQNLISNGSPFTLSQHKACKSTTLSLFALVSSPAATLDPSSTVANDMDFCSDETMFNARDAEELPWNVYRPKLCRDQSRSIEEHGIDQSSSFLANFVPRWNHKLTLKNNRSAGPNRYVFHGLSPERIDLADNQQLCSDDGRPIIWTQYVPSS